MINYPAAASFNLFIVFFFNKVVKQDDIQY